VQRLPQRRRQGEQDKPNPDPVKHDKGAARRR
jgi:hypothetical protein